MRFEKVTEVFIADVRRAGGRDGAAVDPFQTAGIRQFGQIATDGLQGDAESFGIDLGNPATHSICQHRQAIWQEIIEMEVRDSRHD